MAFTVEIVDEIVVFESKMGMVGDYVRLAESDDAEFGEFNKWWSSLIWWIKALFLCIFSVGIGIVLAVFVGPLIVKKVVIPTLEWEMATFSRPALGLSVFACIAVLPVLLLPSTPCSWVAGMTFGYGYGFLLIMGGAIIGMSLPFFIGSLFQDKIHKWLENWPKKAAVIRLAGAGNWFDQFRAVALIRFCPIPYVVFNYAAVATNVTYFPYICGSLPGTVLDTFFMIYSGRLLRTFADATTEHGFLSVEQIIYDAVGFGAAIAVTVAVTFYAKRAVRTFQVEDGLC